MIGLSSMSVHIGLERRAGHERGSSTIERQARLRPARQRGAARATFPAQLDAPA